MDNYPPGVSGNEDVFGPQEEEEFMDLRTCDDGCDFEGEVCVVRQVYNSGSVEYWDCPKCTRNHETDIELSELYPDSENEEHADA